MRTGKTQEGVPIQRARRARDYKLLWVVDVIQWLKPVWDRLCSLSALGKAEDVA